ncbi:hypothetical protein BDY19DRAFT_662746 [Irpex rosettiformis]|uniref:Uncharacterized protein n=1 Tax=Irpex rosettiformis TaxID=378272 RepID=A0ACB8TN50_9APHY|nr:hypothetical protein BDY19DRAFT_662746 [Irpex rosettiformis]
MSCKYDFFPQVRMSVGASSHRRRGPRVSACRYTHTSIYKILTLPMSSRPYCELKNTRDSGRTFSKLRSSVSSPNYRVSYCVPVSKGSAICIPTNGFPLGIILLYLSSRLYVAVLRPYTLSIKTWMLCVHKLAPGAAVRVLNVVRGLYLAEPIAPGVSA